MHVGDRIKSRRKELGISPEDLAEAASISRATIFRYESGDTDRMPAVTLELIASKLRTTPSFLMGWSDSEEENSNTADTIAAHISKDVTEEELQDIIEYIEFRKSQRKK